MILVRIFLVAFLLVIGVAVYIRLAPSDPVIWNVDPADPANWSDQAAVFCPDPGGRYDLQGDLAALDAVAMASPRTTRLSGSVAEGRITWVTRSRLMGYPDYTTAGLRDVDGRPMLCAFARQRFGRLDGGVNAARLGGWLQAAYGLSEVPDMVRPGP